MMTWLHGHWKLLAVIAVALVVAIVVVEPSYNDAQSAPDAERFRAVVGDEPAPFRSAAVVDIGFAVAYGLVALGFAAPARLSRAGAWIVVAGAAADVVENVLVFTNAGDLEGLDDGAVELMRAAGAAKYAGIVAGTLLLVAGRIAARRGR